MIPLACSNCCFNALQYGSFGLSVGFCVEHRVVLRRADETTCGRHLRKDALVDTAMRTQRAHCATFDAGTIRLLRTKQPPRDGVLDASTAVLETDSVGEAVADYGMLESKGASLAQMRAMQGPRAELATLSLGRTYGLRCHQRRGPWTSGLSILWWTRKHLASEPRISVGDLRYQTAASLDRQAELAAWSLVMLRLTYISDVGSFAPESDSVSGLRSFAEVAAEASETPDLAALSQWIRSEGLRLFDERLPVDRFRNLREAVHREREEKGEGD